MTGGLTIKITTAINSALLVEGKKKKGEDGIFPGTYITPVQRLYLLGKDLV